MDPLVPWVGVTAAGYVLGSVFAWNAERRSAFLVGFGVGLTLAVIILRVINVYGDPVRWSVDKSVAFTVLSSLNAIKHPSSSLFLLTTLGPAMLLLYASNNCTPANLRPVLVYGRVPLFYFALHGALIHLVALAVCYAGYYQLHWTFKPPSVSQYPLQPRRDGPQPAVDLSHLGLSCNRALPCCSWSATLKRRRHGTWFSYL